MDGRPIGIFDSGVGGLTVVKRVKEVMPNEGIVYFGDTARMPYGGKTRETVTAYAKQIIDFLINKNVKAIIIACGTVSSNSYEELTGAYDIPLVEMVSTGAKAVAHAACTRGVGVHATCTRRVGVVATEATIASGAHARAIYAIDPSIEVIAKAAPLFVPLIEEGWTDNDVAQSVCDIYIKEITARDIDALLLGCTHYPLLSRCIAKSAGEGVEIVDPAFYAANAMLSILTDGHMERGDNTPPQHQMYISDNPAKFRRICEIVTGRAEDAVMVRLD